MGKTSLDTYYSRSVAPASTVSTRTFQSQSKTPKKATAPRLSALEEREARKYEKLLREIAKIEYRVAHGEQVEQNQLEKLQRKADVCNTLVMQKVRAGFER